MNTRRRHERVALITSVVTLLLAAPVQADLVPDRLQDPTDGRLDASAFLDSAYGFVPLLSPITEPAVGYGALGALVFIDRKPAVEGQPFVRPNLAVVGGLATENGTDGVFAAHLGTWREGRLRTTVAIADADINLSFFGFGTGGDGRGLDYAVSATGGVAGGSYRLKAWPLWLGLKYVLANTHVQSRDAPRPDLEIPASDRNLRLAAITPALTYDTRDNFFTPTRGVYLDLSMPVFREDFGGDRDFELTTLSAMYFHPLGDELFLGVRGAGKSSSGGTPFYLRPYVALRGVPALRYQGEDAAEVEAELRWQFHPRYSAVGFGGVGKAWSEIAGRDRSSTVGAGGLGVRYLLARQYGLHMGLDVAFGPDDPVIYVVFGSQWLRP